MAKTTLELPFSPGYYTLRLTVKDQLGRKSYASKVVPVSDYAGVTQVAVDNIRGPKKSLWQGTLAGLAGPS